MYVYLFYLGDSTMPLILDLKLVKDVVRPPTLFVFDLFGFLIARAYPSQGYQVYIFSLRLLCKATGARQGPGTSLLTEVTARVVRSAAYIHRSIDTVHS